MDKKIVLMELLETVDIIRHEDSGHHKRKKEDCSSEKQDRSQEKNYDKTQEERQRRHRSKISLPAQNALCLLLKEGSLNQRSIAKQVHVTGQAISELMKKLESREWVLRTQGEQNNENIITLTEKGKEKARELEEKRQKRAETLFKDFTEEEMKSLLELLEKISRNKSQQDEATEETNL